METPLLYLPVEIEPLCLCILVWTWAGASASSHTRPSDKLCVEPSHWAASVVVVEGVRVGVGFGGDKTHSVREKCLKRRVSILPFDSVVSIFGIASHSEMSHLDVKSDVFLK